MVGRDLFIAPLGEADGIAPFGEADGAIKRLRPTTAPLSVELRRHPIHPQRVVAEAIWSDRSFRAFPNEQRIDRRAQSLYCAARRGRWHCALGEADGAIKRLRPTTAPLSVELRRHPIHLQRVVAEAIRSG